MDSAGKTQVGGHHDLMDSSDFINNEKFGHTQTKDFENFKKNDNLVQDDFEHVGHEFGGGHSTQPQLGFGDVEQKTFQSSTHDDDFTGFNKPSNLENFDDLMHGVSGFSAPVTVEKKIDDIFEGSNVSKPKDLVDDLLNMERNDDLIKPVTFNPPTTTESSKTQFDIEDDYLNPYASKNVTESKEKVVPSSDDLIEPFKSENFAEPTNKTYMAYDEDEIIKNFDQGPSSFNAMETEAIVHDSKPSFDEEIIKKPITPEPVRVPTPEPVKVIKAPTPEPTPEPVVVKPVPVPEPAVQPIKPVIKPVATERSAKSSTTNKMTSAEEMFCSLGLDAWFKPERLHPKVESLIYWRDPKKSGVVFGAGLALLIAMSCFSLISVFAYVSLIVLAGTVAFRIYKNILQAVQKTSEGHPFKEYLELDLSFSQEKVQQIATVGVAHVNAFVAELRRLFLVEDLVDSIKFGLLLWVLTYMGAWFNGMTLVIISFVALFTLPKVYENNKQSIDTYLDLVRSKILEITDKVKAAIPIGKKAETEKDK